MANLDIFAQFVVAFPQWRLWLSGTNTYGLQYQPASGYDTAGYNPESAKPIQVGSVVFWVDTLTTEVKFDGTSLNFRIGGQAYRCYGESGLLTVRG